MPAVTLAMKEMMKNYLSTAILTGSMILTAQAQAATCAQYYTDKFQKERSNHVEAMENFTIKVAEENAMSHKSLVGSGVLLGGLIGSAAMGFPTSGLSSGPGAYAGAAIGATVGAGAGALGGLSAKWLESRKIEQAWAPPYQATAEIFSEIEKGDSLYLRTLHHKLQTDLKIEVSFEDMMVTLNDLNLTCGQQQNLDFKGSAVGGDSAQRIAYRTKISENEILTRAVLIMKARGMIN